MAIRIFEFAYPVMALRPSAFLAKQSGTVTASSQPSAAFQLLTQCVTVQADEACHVAFGASPVATTTDFKIAAGDERDFFANGGDKIAWIQA